MESVLPENKENRTRKMDDTMHTEESEEEEKM